MYYHNETRKHMWRSNEAVEPEDGRGERKTDCDKTSEQLSPHCSLALVENLKQACQ